MGYVGGLLLHGNKLMGSTPLFQSHTALLLMALF